MTTKSFTGTVMLNWVLPEINGRNIDTITLNIIQARAISPLKIRFDSNRNGWIIGMDRTILNETTGEMELVLPDQEMAFIPAWNEVESQ